FTSSLFIFFFLVSYMLNLATLYFFFFFFFNDPATTEIYTLSLHDALPISAKSGYSRSTIAQTVAAAGCCDELPANRRRRTGSGISPAKWIRRKPWRWAAKSTTKSPCDVRAARGRR